MSETVRAVIVRELDERGFKRLPKDPTAAERMKRYRERQELSLGPVEEHASGDREGRYYVYKLIDPRDWSTFYIGKGSGNRIKSHIDEADRGYDSPKCTRIREIQTAGHCVCYRIDSQWIDPMDAFARETELMKTHDGLTNISGNAEVRKQANTKRNGMAHKSVTVRNGAGTVRNDGAVSTIEQEQPDQTPTAATWGAYSEAYLRRHHALPVRNAKVNGMLTQFIKRVPVTEAPAIASWYVASNRGLYVSSKHPVELLLRDAEALRTGWATGHSDTDTEARQIDATAARGNVWGRLIEEVDQRAREQQDQPGDHHK